MWIVALDRAAVSCCTHVDNLSRISRLNNLHVESHLLYLGLLCEAESYTTGLEYLLNGVEKTLRQ